MKIQLRRKCRCLVLNLAMSDIPKFLTLCFVFWGGRLLLSVSTSGDGLNWMLEIFVKNFCFSKIIKAGKLDSSNSNITCTRSYSSLSLQNQLVLIDSIKFLAFVALLEITNCRPVFVRFNKLNIHSSNMQTNFYFQSNDKCW